MGRALVTGATAGIGAEFCRQLAIAGTHLVMVARDEARLTARAEELRREHGVEVEVLRADLADRDDLLRVAERCESADAPIDLLVNNAGFGLHAKLLDKDFTIQERALDVMCLAVHVLASAAGRQMVSRGRGAILNVASSSAYITTGNYSAVKAWCLVYTEGLSVELHGTGVTATALCPGWVHTEFHERANITAGPIPEPVWIPVDRLVREALADTARGKVISVPTKRWRFAVELGRHVPRGTVRFFSRLLSGSRKKAQSTRDESAPGSTVPDAAGL
ncbi:short-chain dehydrogenase [Parenemella sanctibonifatiensis]|uniref:Short-chain dehydrogenase n=1 Tax=Parenemella sanctibonifatiensis TaxID=2016505 RepID=A0A255EFP7_9ACTN|nr:SDR family NAD(P)-dependent oxidoreductase [Parenemella sanctibonifatiensis]OYN90358.1 short-chain dehydrogenase [Parenemella sanctibonifatiensis]